MTYRLPNARKSNFATEPTTAHQDLATRTRRTPALYIGHNGLADLVWEGKLHAWWDFPGGRAKTPLRPIHVVEAHEDHFQLRIAP